MIHPTETIRTVAEHLAKQGRASVDEAASCRYLAPNGDKCAAGVFLPPVLAEIADLASDPGVFSIMDEEMNPGDEFDEIRAIFRERDPRLLAYLQCEHDACVGLEREACLRKWRDEGAKVAERFGVTPEVWTGPFDRALAGLAEGA